MYYITPHGVDFQFNCKNVPTVKEYYSWDWGKNPIYIKTYGFVIFANLRWKDKAREPVKTADSWLQEKRRRRKRLNTSR